MAMDSNYIYDQLKADLDCADLMTLFTNSESWRIPLENPETMAGTIYTDIFLNYLKNITEFITDLLSYNKSADDKKAIQNIKYFYLMANMTFYIKQAIQFDRKLEYKGNPVYFAARPYVTMSVDKIKQKITFKMHLQCSILDYFTLSISRFFDSVLPFNYACSIYVSHGKTTRGLTSAPSELTIPKLQKLFDEV